ncbi:MAG: VanZ family protein [Bacteroidetes bacterium]|nr:MAG: VanZ family protein [Bacteroidota bacterium]
MKFLAFNIRALGFMNFKYLLPGIVWIIVILAIIAIPGSSIPRTSLFEIPHFDKLIHFVMFAILSILLGFGFFRQQENSIYFRKRYTFVLVLCVIYGGATEIIQHLFVAGRSGELWDFAANTAGSFAGILLFSLLTGKPGKLK